MRKLILVLLILLLGTSPVRAEGWNIEVGQQLAPTEGQYLLVRYNWLAADLPALGSQVWFLPEAGVVTGWPPAGYGRVQVLLDTPVATFGVDGRAGVGEDYGRIFVRFDL